MFHRYILRILGILGGDVFYLPLEKKKSNVMYVRRRAYGAEVNS